jgi:hypothetical protein
VDSLPDLSTIEARVLENAPGEQVPETQTGLSGTKKAILATVGLATAGAALFGAAPQAHAGPRHNRGYGGYGGYGGNHRHNHRHGGNDAGAIIGGIILGTIIGGAIANQPPPVYYPPTVPQYPQYPQQVQQPFYDNYGRLICPNSQGGWYVSADQYQCRSSRW